MASNAFRSNADYDDSKVGLPSVFSFNTIQRAWEGASIPTYMVNSLWVVTGTVLLSIVVASMAGELVLEAALAATRSGLPVRAGLDRGPASDPVSRR